MTPIESPPRLLRQSPFADVLQDAANDRWSPERLARNELAIQNKIVGLAAAGIATGAAVSAAKAGVVGAAKVGGAIKIGVTIAVVASASTAAVVLVGDREPDPPAPVTKVVVAEPAEPITPPTELLEPAEPTEPPAPLRAKHAKRRKPAKSPAANNNALDDQLRMFGAAKKAAKRGDYDGALAQLDALLKQHPNSRIRAEAYLARAEYLVQAGRDTAAMGLIDSIIDKAPMAGKKAQLLQLSADIWLRRGRCDRAIPAYHRALGLGLEPKAAAAAQAGLKRCAQQ